MQRKSIRSTVISLLSSVPVLMPIAVTGGEEAKGSGIAISHQAAADFPGVDGVTRITFTSGMDGKEDYAFIRHPSADPSVKTNNGVWLVYLHGHWNNADQLYTRKDIKATWLPCFIKENFGMVSPQYRGDSWMCPEAAADLHALLDYLRKEHGARKFVFFGGSMGGTSSLIYATLHPQDVSVCVACCPDTDLPSFLDFCRVEKNQKDYTVLKDVLQKITAFYKNDAAVIARHSALQHVDKLTMPIRIVHGAQDPLAPVDQSRRLKAALEGRNTHFVYVEIPGGGHETPGQKVYFDASLAWAVKELAERP